MSKIRIVNWLLTRRCNLKCHYCAIVKDYKDMPQHYPEMKYYLESEMSTARVIRALEKFKRHNPDAFHIFYGGEPLLRKDLHLIIDYCNLENIHYTIISNNTRQIQHLIDNLIKNTTTIKGFTASVDPILVRKCPDYDRLLKSEQGFNSLVQMKKYVNDVVAEITVMQEDIDSLYSLVKMLSDNGISSDITFIDVAKSPYYDFSNISNEALLVQPSPRLKRIFDDLCEDESLDIHMKDTLLPEIFKILPSNMDCKIEDGLHNVSIDADGSVRLCLRVRGVVTPQAISMETLLTDDGQVSNVAHLAIKRDKAEFCKLCNHTCQIMSRIIDEEESSADDLVHLDRRD